MVPWFCVCVYVLIAEKQVGEAYNKEEKNALIFQDERVHERILFFLKISPPSFFKEKTKKLQFHSLAGKKWRRR